MERKARLIAYYLPQYHPIPENDKWWGKGFTEWVLVAGARPLFVGHEQPKIPGELGFYDLRLEETRIRQAELAREHGIEGFCYWHYWMGNGKRLLERPFNEVLESGVPDFPFCLAWANHSWNGVFFGARNKQLIEQKYGGKEDEENHFNYLLRAFKDPRYILVEGKPLLIIFDIWSIPECKGMMDFWRELALRAGLKGLHIVGIGNEVSEKWLERFGLDASNCTRHRHIGVLDKSEKHPKIYQYKDAMKHFLKPGPYALYEYPSIVPNWDTTPRLGEEAVIFIQSTPELFARHVRQVLRKVIYKPMENRIVMIKSWNEWAEGNYLEPDWKYQRAYLEVIKEEIMVM